MLKRDLNKITLELYWNHTHARMHPWKFAAHAQNDPLQENTSGGLFLYVKRDLKNLNYKKSPLIAVKKNYLNKIRLLLRFFDSSYFTSRFYFEYFFRKLAQFFSSCLFTRYLFKYDKSRVEKFSKAK